jgi:hypothetical protein
VAKRTRASRSTHRPGGLGPSRSKKTSSASSAAGQPDAPAEADLDAAVASVEAEYTELTIEETAPAETATPAAHSTRRRSRRRTKARSDDLEARAGAESVWVREDLRRIGIVSVALLAGLAVAWVVFVVLDVLSLY